jgi:hypothetical protein
VRSIAVIALVVIAGCGGKREGQPATTSAPHDQADELHEALIVSVSPQNQIHVRGRRVGVADLDPMFADAFAADPRTVVVVATADGVPPRAALVVERARAAGLEVAMAIDEDRRRGPRPSRRRARTGRRAREPPARREP